MKIVDIVDTDFLDKLKNHFVKMTRKEAQKLAYIIMVDKNPGPIPISRFTAKKSFKVFNSGKLDTLNGEKILSEGEVGLIYDELKEYTERYNQSKVRSVGFVNFNDFHKSEYNEPKTNTPNN